jgi:VanZ family protein
VKRLVIEYWIPLFVWLTVIFIFSTDSFSGGQTSRLIVPVLRFFFPGLTMPQLDMWHGIIRKVGHFSEYFILATLTYRSVKQHSSDLTQAFLRTFLFVVVAAMSDELHQAFTHFRSASPIDVGYDCLGAVSALWLAYTYEARRLRTHSIL